ncbi:MAG TPA: hypothetical protein VGC41_18635 [Kofleriaceae bacterium]
MRILIALPLLATACQQDAKASTHRNPAPAPKAVVVPVPPEQLPRVQPLENPADMAKCGDRCTVPDGFPTPPTDQPVIYAKWLAAQPAKTRTKIDGFCGKQKTNYEFVCGGIGRLHIPYPPFPRARMQREGKDLESHFSNGEAWSASLTKAQQRYIDHNCERGEDAPSSDLCGDNTPLVIAFDREHVEFTAGAPYDQPTAETPWLAIDRNHDGRIESSELFGSDTLLPDGSHAVNGFAALAVLDENHDNVIDARDPQWAQLVLVRDGQIGDAGSLTRISLDDRVEAHCDARGNCEGERASLTWRNRDGELRSGTVIDIYRPTQHATTRP